MERFIREDRKPTMAEMLVELREEGFLSYHFSNPNSRALECFSKPLTSTMPIAKPGETHLKRLANYAVAQREDGLRIGAAWEEVTRERALAAMRKAMVMRFGEGRRRDFTERQAIYSSNEIFKAIEWVDGDAGITYLLADKSSKDSEGTAALAHDYSMCIVFITSSWLVLFTAFRDE